MRLTTMTREEKPRRLFAIVPQKALTILDGWNVIALSGTGSNDVALKDHFVPAHMTIWEEKRLRGGPQHRQRGLTASSYEHTGIAIGIAQRALREASAALAARPGASEVSLNQLGRLQIQLDAITSHVVNRLENDYNRLADPAVDPDTIGLDNLAMSALQPISLVIASNLPIVSVARPRCTGPISLNGCFVMCTERPSMLACTVAISLTSDSARGGGQATMRIDVHSHYNPPDYFAALRAVGGWDELSIFRALGHIWKPGSATAVMGADKATLKCRLDDMDASKIDKQILSIGAAHPYLKREDDAARIARALNDAYAALLAEAPSRLLAFAMLPLPHVEASLAELDGALARPGVVGVALGASAQGVPLDDARSLRFGRS